MVYFQNKIDNLLCVISKQIVSPILLSCQPRVTVATFFVIPRRSRRDIVLAPSVRPHFLSVRNHISVPIGQI